MMLAETPTARALAARVLLDALMECNGAGEKTQHELVVEVFLWEQMDEPELAALIANEIE